MKTKRKDWVKAKLIGVSPKVHEKLSKEAFNSKPRRNLRQHMNLTNGFSHNE